MAVHVAVLMCILYYNAYVCLYDLHYIHSLVKAVKHLYMFENYLNESFNIYTLCIYDYKTIFKYLNDEFVTNNY